MTYLRYILMIVLVAVLQATAFPQLKLDGTIYDYETKSPIPYTIVGVAKLAIGTVSDRDGYFELNDFRIKKETEVTISCIGYETSVVTAHQLSVVDDIYLIPKSYDVELVEITSTALTDIEVQYGVSSENSRGRSIGFANQQLGTEIGTAIYIKKPSFIESAHFEINHAKGDSMHYRVLLRPFKNGKLQESILPADVCIHEKQRKGTVDIDLSSYNLNLKGKYLLSLQWIQNDGMLFNEGLTFDTKRGGRNIGIWAKVFSTDKLKKLSFHGRLKPCFYLKGVLTK